MSVSYSCANNTKTYACANPGKTWCSEIKGGGNGGLHHQGEAAAGGGCRRIRFFLGHRTTIAIVILVVQTYVPTNTNKFEVLVVVKLIAVVGVIMLNKPCDT